MLASMSTENVEDAHEDERCLHWRSRAPPCAVNAQEPAPGGDARDAGSMGARARSPIPPASIGPALMSGRISHIAVHPENKQTWYIGVASGGVWKTTNAGITFTPVFQNEGVYSIGTVVIDPKNPTTIWVGTGEANNQRSVGYGDGIYRSDDAGRTWRNVGLQDVGADRPHRHRSARFERGVRRRLRSAVERGRRARPLQDRPTAARTGPRCSRSARTPASATSRSIPFNPDVMLAVAHQRRRHTWTLIHGGPESGLHKSTDGGKTWRRIRAGLPGGDVGRIVIAFSPAQKGLVYAKVESSGQPVALYASLDGGDSWERRGNVQAQPMYYKNIHADPKDPDRVYVPSVQTQISDDGGRTFRGLGERNKHVDNHYIWIDPDDTDHLLEGCDGGLYESWDGGRLVAALHQSLGDAVLQRRSRQRVANLQRLRRHAGQQPRSAVRRDRARPMARPTTTGSSSPAATASSRASTRPIPNIVYAESQYGGIVRLDRRTSERVNIKPVEGKGEAAAALQLGIAVHHQPAQPVAAVLRRQSAVPQRRSRQHVARRSVPT